MIQTTQIDPGTRDALQRMVTLARSGASDEARRVGKDALLNVRETAPLHAFLGRLACDCGDLDEGISHLRLAIEQMPSDVYARCDLAAALINSGDMEGAYEACDLSQMHADRSLQIARFRGYSAQQLEYWPQAIEAYRHVVKNAPQDAGTWNNLGNALAAAENFDEAIEALQQAARLNLHSAPTRLNLANTLTSCGKWDEAREEYQKGIKDFPQDHNFPLGLYGILRFSGDDDGAIDALEETIKRDPQNPSHHVLLGNECSSSRRFEQAEAELLEAIRLQPDHAEAHTSMAELLERMNRDDELPGLIEVAQERGVDQSSIEFIRILEHRRANRFAEGLESLSQLPSHIDAARVEHLKGQFNDRLGLHDAAFENFSQMNRHFAEGLTQPVARARLFREMLAAERDTLSPEWIAGWTDLGPNPAARSHAFLMGFPRSGTTLLDTFLMGHPGMQVLEERPMLNHVRQSMGDFESLASLTAEQREAAVKTYEQEASQWVSIDPSKLMIDKHPLHTNKAPLIHRIFPGSKMIITLRHPCDVILSCFMTNFRLNSAMANFLSLEAAAEFYDLTFGYWEKARSLLPLDVHTMCYERMVLDQKAELQPLIGFLGLQWSDEMLDHRSTARDRGVITTASYSQVTEPIYRRASGRWVKYRRHLEPIFPVIAPWVERFGYSLDDPAKLPERDAA